MSRTRVIAGLAAIAVAGGLAALGVVVHDGVTAEYADVDDTAVENWMFAFTGGVGMIALAVVGAAALLAMVVSPRPWMRVVCAAIPVVMVLAMLAVTPLALE